MPYSTACKTVLSNFEANQNYKDTVDPSIYVTFPYFFSSNIYKNINQKKKKKKD